MALTYKWTRNGTVIAGATGPSYTTPAATLSDSGATFAVTVSNGVSSTTSATAALTVYADPEGLYLGTLHYVTAGTTLPVFAIVLKDGTAAAFVTDHVLTTDPSFPAPVGYSLHGLSVKPTLSNFSSTYTAFLQSGYRFSNGQSTSSGTLSGTVVPGSSITGTFSSDLDSGSFTLTALTADYSRPASPATLAGTYGYDSAYYVPSSPTTGTENVFHSVTMTDSTGSTGSATTSTGCTSNGSTNQVPDPQHNANTVTAVFSCPPPQTPTMTFTALSAFFPAGTGAGIISPSAFATDTTLIITDDAADQISFLIVSEKQ
jgi:hypothetical protein